VVVLGAPLQYDHLMGHLMGPLIFYSYLYEVSFFRVNQFNKEKYICNIILLVLLSSKSSTTIVVS